MKREKEQRFEKVVEWEKEPNILNLAISLILYLIGLLFIFMPPVSLYWTIFGLVLIFISGMLFHSSSGEGRKVTWRKIK